jgi:hypothetical protein
MPMAERAVRLYGVVVLLPAAGWAHYGMSIGVRQWSLSMDATLVVHAAGAPIGFALHHSMPRWRLPVA